jgi:hypothetical protein
MTNIEDELRGLYRAVTDQVREEDLPGPFPAYRPPAHRPPAHRERPRRFAPLAAAAAVVIVVAASLSVPRLLSSPGRLIAAPTTVTPPFGIAESAHAPGDAVTLTAVDMATGRVTGTVPSPGTGRRWSRAVSTGSATTFVLAAVLSHPGNDCQQFTYLYRLTLSASGAPVSLRPWTFPEVDGTLQGMTVSADGSTIAYSAVGCDLRRRETMATIGVIRGHTDMTWFQTQPPFSQDLALSADGSLLAYVASDGSRMVVRMLGTRSAPADPTNSGTVVHSYPANALVPHVLLDPGGATAYFFWADGTHYYLTRYRIGSHTTLYQQTVPAAREVAWAGSKLFAWGGRETLLIDPATGQVALFPAPWLAGYDAIVW